MSDLRKVAALRAGFETLPEIGIAAWLGGRRPLVLAPHPDDESLGCGGMIAAACAIGLPPAVVICTDGAASHPGSRDYPPARLRALREAETLCATGRLGLPRDQVRFLGQPDTRLPGGGPAFEALVSEIADIGRDAGCAMVVGPWAGDPHCDHEAAARLAARIAAGQGWPLRSYPVWGWLRDGEEMLAEPRRGGWRLDIAAHLAAKQRAIAAHVSQHGDLITDSPAGFRLPAALLAVFARPFEVYIE